MNIYRPTRLVIDLSVIAENVRLLRAQTPASACFMAVVKADAYGHGAIPVARAALAAGADALAVAIPEEGVQLREAGFTAPILVLGAIAREGAEAAASFALTQTVFNLEQVAWLEEAAKRQNTSIDTHIKVDSGMGRIGVRDGKALSALVEAVSASPHLRLKGAFTHFATADGADLSYTRQQVAKFRALAEPLKAAHPGFLLHAANSAALLRCPEYAFDMVRAGIALYVNPRLPDDAGEGLAHAMSWETQAVHVKEIDAGETVSYGRQFTAERPTRVMTLPVGYADGYHRSIGGKGRALVRGQSAPVIGRVCMDQTMLDVTDIPGAAVGDPVVLLGAQGNERITAGEMGAWCSMIDYEIVLSPTSRVPKAYRISEEM